ncbi:hypothetical protein J7384_18580 [Endozoicomonas sp. G2_1]|uniref:hypothetical protein n=1 Tax=Endozoicomonas sp. G2_1 TaxID=2821091 RepID=UPI001ADAEA1E|nr:hypothetical protein [Endozoicomonas sp. G2_1]MBO9492375.1 hypothetical protein [Endozoicomonas sp. G2_1]
MKAGDIIATKNNKFIKFATFGTWSHVGIALNEQEILEATPDGIKPINIDEILERDKELLLLERPVALSEKQIDILNNKSTELINRKLKYGHLRAAYSGAPHIFHNIFTFLSLLCLSGAIFLYYLNESVEHSYTLLLLSVFSNFVGIPFAKSTGTVRQTNKFLEKINAPKFLLTDLDKMFCSQVVEDLDKHIGGNISILLGRSHELRPKDIVIACEELEWKSKNITSVSNATAKSCA